MSTPPKKPVPPRRVSANPPTRGTGGNASADVGRAKSPREGAASAPRPSASGAPKANSGNRNVLPPPQQSRQRAQQGYRQQPAQSRRPAPDNYYYAPAPPRRDPFPILMGGIIGALVMGLVIVIFLLTQNNNNNVGNTPNNQGGAPAVGGTSAPNTGADPTQPDRLSLADFKALYDDPAKRPVILDVRTKQSYDEGHITGAINIPVVETDARLAELPKDKLIVAYCQ